MGQAYPWTSYMPEAPSPRVSKALRRGTIQHSQTQQTSHACLPQELVIPGEPPGCLLHGLHNGTSGCRTSPARKGQTQAGEDVGLETDDTTSNGIRPLVRSRQQPEGQSGRAESDSQCQEPAAPERRTTCMYPHGNPPAPAASPPLSPDRLRMRWAVSAWAWSRAWLATLCRRNLSPHGYALCRPPLAPVYSSPQRHSLFASSCAGAIIGSARPARRTRVRKPGNAMGTKLAS